MTCSEKSALSGLVIAVTQATGLEILSLFLGGVITVYSSLTHFATQWSGQYLMQFSYEYQSLATEKGACSIYNYEPAPVQIGLVSIAHVKFCPVVLCSATKTSRLVSSHSLCRPYPLTSRRALGHAPLVRRLIGHFSAPTLPGHCHTGSLGPAQTVRPPSPLPTDTGPGLRREGFAARCTVLSCCLHHEQSEGGAVSPVMGDDEMRIVLCRIRVLDCASQTNKQTGFGEEMQ